MRSSIRQHLEVGNEGKIETINIETGDFEIDETIMVATDRIFERHPGLVLGNSDWTSLRLSFWGTEFEEKSMMHGVVNLRREATQR